MTDKERLDWLEAIMTPGNSYVEVYLAGLRAGRALGPGSPWDATGYQVELQGKLPASGETLREAIDAARAAHELNRP